MRTYRLYLLILFLLISCGEYEKTEKLSTPSPGLELLDMTDGETCLAETLSYEEKDDSLDVAVKTDGLTASISIYSLLLNCCADQLAKDLSWDGEKIIISITETGDQCDCICPYDVSLSFSVESAGQYPVAIYTPSGLWSSTIFFKKHD